MPIFSLIFRKSADCKAELHIISPKKALHCALIFPSLVINKDGGKTEEEAGEKKRFVKRVEWVDGVDTQDKRRNLQNVGKGQTERKHSPH